MRSLVICAFVVFGVGGCKQCNRTPDVSADPGVRASASAPAVALRSDAGVIVDGGVVALPSLLRTTHARIAVSSLVDNPNTSPNDLIDGRVMGAWNGKTGDLVGGWIAFRVPVAAYVNAIVLSTGLNQRGSDGSDLFSQNHRITRVHITRNGTALRDADLDPNVRTPQRIPIDDAGGDYKIEVLATLPGTKPTWRELVVTNFDVLGIPGAAKTSDEEVGVRVGSLDAPPWLTRLTLERVAGLSKPGPWPSIDAYCKEYDRVLANAARDANQSVTDFVDHCSIHPSPNCTHDAVTFEGTLGPPLQAMEYLTVYDHDHISTWLAIQSTKGWFVQADEIESRPCLSANEAGEVKRELVRIDRPQQNGGGGGAAGAALIEVVLRSTSWSPFYGEQGPVMSRWGTHHLAVCRFRDALPDCDESYILGKWSSSDAFDAAADFPPNDQWNDMKTFAVLSDGGIELHAKTK